MANPQKENGYVGIANALWDEVIRRDFSKRHTAILMLIWRMSYGCQRREATIPRLQDFSLCGVGPNHIANELEYLEGCKVITWDRDRGSFQINKDYDLWQISPTKGWDSERYKSLVHRNLEAPRKGKVNFPKQEEELDEELPETGSESSSENFPKQEAAEVSEHDETSQNRKLELPKTGSEKADEPNDGALSELQKDSIKDIKKDLNNIYVDWFDRFWDLYPKKVGKQKTKEKFIKMAPKLNIDEVFKGTENYIAYCKKIGRFLKDPSTFVNQSGWADFLEADSVEVAIVAGGHQASSKPSNLSYKNEQLMSEIEEEVRWFERERSEADISDHPECLQPI